MADGKRTGQRVHHTGIREIIAHIPETAGRVEPFGGVIADDPARLLAAMLQRVKAKGHKIRGIRHTDHTKDAAFFTQLIIREGIKGMGGEMCGARGRKIAGHRRAPACGHSRKLRKWASRLHALTMAKARRCHLLAVMNASQFVLEIHV